jgi:hypothetical protein
MSGDRPFVTHDLNNVFLTYQQRLGGSIKHSRTRFHSSNQDFGTAGNSGVLTAGNLAESALTKRGGGNLMDAYRDAMQHFYSTNKDFDETTTTTPKPQKKEVDDIHSGKFIEELQEESAVKPATNMDMAVQKTGKPKKDFIQELQDEHFAKPPAPIAPVPGGTEDAFDNNIATLKAPKKDFLQELQEHSSAEDRVADLQAQERFHSFVKPHAHANANVMLSLNNFRGPAKPAKARLPEPGPFDGDLPPSARLPEPRFSLVEATKPAMTGFAGIQEGHPVQSAAPIASTPMNAQSFSFNGKKTPPPIDVGFAELPADARLPYREPRLSLSETSVDSWSSSIPWESTEAAPQPRRTPRRQRAFRGRRNAPQYRRDQKAPQRMPSPRGGAFVQSVQQGYQGGGLMQSMQQQFAQDLMSVESSPREYNAPMKPLPEYDENQGSEKPLPDLRLYRSPNHKPLAMKVGSLFDGGIDVREERRRKEEKLWGHHPQVSQRPASMPDVENAIEDALPAPTPLAMNSQSSVVAMNSKSSSVEMASKPSAMASDFADPSPLAMNVQGTSNTFTSATPTSVAMNAQDPAVNADGMLNEMRSEVSSVAMHPEPPPPPVMHENRLGNAREMRRPQGRDPIMSKLADVQRKLLALHHKGHPKVEMKPSPLIPDEDSPDPMPAPQPQPASPARHHNRLWDTNFVRPPVQSPPVQSQAALSADMAIVTAEVPEAPPRTRVSAPPKKKFAKASVKASKPPVKALLSHKISKDATNSLDSVLDGKITIPSLPSVSESRAALESQEAKKQVALEEAEEAVKISEPSTAPTDATVSSPAATKVDAKEPKSPQKPEAAVKTENDLDGDSDVGTSDSDEEDDKDLAKLEKQVDDFEDQQNQAKKQDDIDNL